MIDKIYFLGNDNKSKDEIKVVTDNVALYTPQESGDINIKSASTLIGHKILKLFEVYDIVYLDLRLLNTTDVGMGFLSEFGFEFYSKENKKLEPMGINVYYINRIEIPDLKEFDGKKLRLILSFPENNPYRKCRTGASPLGVLEYELMKRSFLNLEKRLEKSGFDVTLDLKARDGGGLSSIISTLLKDDIINYYILAEVDVNEFLVYDKTIKEVSIEEVFTDEWNTWLQRSST